MAALPDALRQSIHVVTAVKETRDAATFNTYFPDCLPECVAGSLVIEDHVVRPGFRRPTCRCLYPRSVLCFLAGALHRERLFLAANRTSKTVSAAYEVTCHLTGRYPHWWVGQRFDHPIQAWGAGDTTESTRNVIQKELCGPHELVPQRRYAGMIPPQYITGRTLKSGSVADCIDALYVEHVARHHGAPLYSTFEFKAYNQGRLSFQGTEKHLVWLDEEPPDATEDTSGGGTPSGNGDIYTECLLRTATVPNGLIIATFTPLRGLTPFLDQFLETATMCDDEGVVLNAKRCLFGEEAA